MSTLDVMLAVAIAAMAWASSFFIRRLPARSQSLLYFGLGLFFGVNALLSQHPASLVFALIAAGAAVKVLRAPHALP